MTTPLDGALRHIANGRPPRPSSPPHARSPHADVLRQRALAELLSGASVRAVARQLGVQPSTIRYWRAQSGLDVTRVTPKNTDDLAESIAEYLDDAFHTISAILAATRDPVWIKRQSAGELAVYTGVLSDKVIAVLDRIAAASAQD